MKFLFGSVSYEAECGSVTSPFLTDQCQRDIEKEYWLDTSIERFKKTSLHLYTEISVYLHATY